MRINSKVLGFVAAALFGLGAVAVAQAIYTGFNPVTQLNGVQGVPVSLGPIPVLGAATACGTTATVQASGVGGTGIVQYTAGATSCTLVVNIPTAVTNGVYCVAADETTSANLLKQTAHTTSSCTLTGTVAVSDKILVEINAF